MHTVSSEMDYSKRKEFAPHGSKLFPFRVDPFSEGKQNNFERVVSLESVSISLNQHLLHSTCSLATIHFFISILSKYDLIGINIRIGNFNGITFA